MNINRNNYEEYFLLYADKELSVAEKNMVDVFVEQNPDLEEEFVMLKQSILKPDNNIAFEGQSSLFKEESTFINTNNYEEKFLLYTDNELNLTEIEETEKFVLSHPELLTEFTLLQQVKYEPDTAIVFPDKNSLYKKEDVTKVIPFRWKALAAAVLLGIGLWTGISYIQKDNIEPPVATSPIVKKTEVIKNSIEPKDENKLTVTKQENIAPKKRSFNATDGNIDQNLAKQQNVPEKNIQPVNKNLKVTNREVEPNEQLVINETENKNQPGKIITDLPNKNNITEPNSKTVSNIAVPQSNYAETASYIAEAEEKSENYVFYNITQEEFQKSKVGIFFKKVKRAIERKNPLREKSFKVSSLQETPNN